MKRPPNKAMRKTITLRLREDIYGECKLIAAITNKNLNEIIEEGMENILEKYKDEKNLAPLLNEIKAIAANS